MNLVKSNFAKKLILVLVVIIVFNAVMPTCVFAEDKDWGGILLKPVFSLVASLIGTVDAAIGFVLLQGDKGQSDASFPDVLADLWDGDKDRDGNSLDVAAPYLIGVDSIFSGQISLLDANMFKSVGGDLRESVRSTVAKIYVFLRNISALIMLIGLVYTGIQILINSNIPTKKTQYLMLLQDWVIGMCLLLLSHVIMNIVFSISDLFIEGFKGAITPTNSAATMNSFLIGKIFDSERTFLKIMGSIPYLLLVIGIIWQSFDFAIAYFRRLLYVCVLIMFAPIFSVMYAFGQQTKQIYSKWLREFVTAVFIQPFHIIVYYVMIMIPVVAFNSDSTNLFTLLYAVICIFMIKPIEAYLKNLVGLNTGIAGSTSAEGGRAIRDAAIKSGVGLYENFRAVHDARKNGASAFEIMGANFRDKYMSNITVGENMQRLTRGDETGTPPNESNPQRDQENEQLAQENSQVHQQLPQGNEDKDDTNEAELASMMGQQMEEAQDKNNEENTKSSEETTSLNAANITIGSANIGMPEFGGSGQFALQEQTEQLREGENEKAELSSEVMENTKKLLDDPSLGLTDEQKEEYMADPQKLANDLPGMKRNLTREIKKGDVGKLISNIDGAIGQRMEDGVTPDEDEYGGDPHTDKRQRVRDLLSSSIRGKANRKEFDFVTSHADGSELTALEEKGEMLSRRKLMDQVSAGLKDSGYNPPTIGANRGATDSLAGNSGINSSARPGTSGVQGTGTVSAGSVTINASSINLQGGTNNSGSGTSGNSGGGQSGTSDGSQSGNNSGSTAGGNSSRTTTSNTLDDIYEIGGRPLTNKDKKEIMVDNGVGKRDILSKSGKSLYEAYHTLQDAMYITPAPGDWKGTQSMWDAHLAKRDEKRKAENEREKNAWANDKANISYRADLHMDKMREIYAGKPEAYIRDKAEEKAKTELAKMSEFVPYGITDVSLASQLYDRQKQYGFSPEQAIRSMAGYNKFNSGKDNIAYAVKAAGEMGVKIEGEVKTVSQALPNAEYYFNSGYTKIEEISVMEDLAKRLQTSPEFTTKIHEALKRQGGNIKTDGLDPKLIGTIEDINKNYRKLLKKKNLV